MYKSSRDWLKARQWCLLLASIQHRIDIIDHSRTDSRHRFGLLTPLCLESRPLVSTEEPMWDQSVHGVMQWKSYLSFQVAQTLKQSGGSSRGAAATWRCTRAWIKLHRDFVCEAARVSQSCHTGAEAEQPTREDVNASKRSIIMKGVCMNNGRWLRGTLGTDLDQENKTGNILHPVKQAVLPMHFLHVNNWTLVLWIYQDF